MEGLTFSVSVVDYIGADDDESIKCDSDVIEYEAIEHDNDGENVDELTDWAIRGSRLLSPSDIISFATA